MTTTSQGASIVAAMTVAWVSGWLSGLWVGGKSRRLQRNSQPEPRFSELLLPRDRDPDWRRSFNHENTNRPSGPPPLLLRRGERVYMFQPRGQGPRSNPNPPPRNP